MHARVFMNLAAALALVNTTRVLTDLENLRAFGATHGGALGRGVSRRALGTADLAARRWLEGRMTAVGLRARLDGLGTVYGEGGDDGEPALLMGSPHLSF